MSAPWTAAREAEIRARIEAAAQGPSIYQRCGDYTMRGDLKDALSEIARLRLAIREAPHEDGCPVIDQRSVPDGMPIRCACYKRDALEGVV